MMPPKFKFDTEFRDEGDRVSLAARGRIKKALSQDEIDQLCAKSRAEGMKAGEARALDAVAIAIDGMAAALRAALAASHAEIEDVRRQACEAAFAMARKLAGHALEHAPQGEVERALREAVHQAVGEPRVMLRANPRVIAALKERLAEIAHEEGFEGRIVPAEDPSMAAADCRIEWRGAGAERRTADIEQSLGELIARRFSRMAEVPA